MVVCKYFLAGRCRYGDNCKYEHPPQANGRNSSNNDPFKTSRRGGNNYSNKNTEENPQWPLSVIGLPEGLDRGNALSGDVSPEELRIMAYSMAPKGISPEVNEREARLVSEHRAKLEALERSGMSNLMGSTSNINRGQDPFAANQSQNGGFNNSFNQQPAHNTDPFASLPTKSDPFGSQIQAPSMDPFGQTSTFNGNIQLSNPFNQQQGPLMNNHDPTPTISDGAREQFNANQFQFGQVPETAPPPPFC